MAYTTPPVQATGDLISASDWNTLIRDNMMTLFPYTTAGDLAYASTSSTLARLAAGAAGTIINSSGSAPQYSSLATLTAASPLVTSQAAGDVFHSTSDNVTARLAVGTAGTFLGASTDSLPAYLSLVYRRQGGDASNWQNAGGSAYTPTTAFVQVGVKAVSVNTTGSGSVTYPVAFAQRPVVFLTPNSGSGNITCQFNNDSVSGFTITLRDVDTSGAITVDVNWMAIGVM